MWTVQSQSAGRPSVRAEALDLAELRDRASNDDELVVELLQDFLSRRSTTFDLKCACTRGSFKELSRLAHRLKGTLLALGAKPAASAASDVEVIASGLIGTGELTSEAPRRAFGRPRRALRAPRRDRQRDAVRRRRRQRDDASHGPLILLTAALFAGYVQGDGLPVWLASCSHRAVAAAALARPAVAAPTAPAVSASPAAAPRSPPVAVAIPGDGAPRAPSVADSTVRVDVVCSIAS